MLNLIIALFLGLACAPQCSVDRSCTNEFKPLNVDTQTAAVPTPIDQDTLEPGQLVEGRILDNVRDRFDQDSEPDADPGDETTGGILDRETDRGGGRRKWFDGSFMRGVTSAILALCLLVALLIVFLIVFRRRGQQ